MGFSDVFLCRVCLPATTRVPQTREKQRQQPGDFWPRSFFFVMNDRPLSSLYLGERLECSFAP